MERSSAETEDEYVALPCRLLVQTRGNGGGGRLVDDTENVEPSDQSSVLRWLDAVALKCAGTRQQPS